MFPNFNPNLHCHEFLCQALYVHNSISVTSALYQYCMNHTGSGHAVTRKLTVSSSNIAYPIKSIDNGFTNIYTSCFKASCFLLHLKYSKKYYIIYFKQLHKEIWKQSWKNNYKSKPEFLALNSSLQLNNVQSPGTVPEYIT